MSDTTAPVYLIFGVYGGTRSALTQRLAADGVALNADATYGRPGTPADVADAIRWLLSAGTAWVTGQVLGVDGGRGRVRSGRA